MPGKIVKTKSGKGQTDNNEQPVKGKIIVTLDSGSKILCSPQNIEIIGYWD